MAYYENNLHEDQPSGRPSTSTCVAASTPRSCWGYGLVGTFVGRDITRTVAENLRLAEEVLPPLVEYAAARDVRLVVENCPMEGWHPDGYPANLAYSPELWDWMAALGLCLNFDPSHLVWLGIDPVAALESTSTGSCTSRPRTSRSTPPPATGTGSSARSSTSVALGQRMVALPDPGARRGRLAASPRRA